LDRLVGYELSPLLWKKVKPSLSAGRVQSVAVRLVVEREEEIKNFKSTSAVRIVVDLKLPSQNGNQMFSAEYPTRFSTIEKAHDFLKKHVGADFKVLSVEKKPGKKSPAAPFTTSTLQQEASRKMGFPVAKTMVIAQKLYESGKITYMRTDSVNLSNLAIGMAKAEISKRYGDEYIKTRKFTTKTKGAQEAHEAIRPTYLNNFDIDASDDEQRLYALIWKRTIASQMSDAKLEKTIVNISSSKAEDNFIARGEVVRFDGFLKVYTESTDDENGDKPGLLPILNENDVLKMLEMRARERFSKQPQRYTEASLVKKMEELGIGRPSTYAPTISTIQKREYVIKESRKARKRDIQLVTLKDSTTTSQTLQENIDSGKTRLYPTDIGTLVNRFLVQYFQNIVDYNFTASVEKEFDEISVGKKEWNHMIREFYGPFHEDIKSTQENSGRFTGERLLGQDPETGKNMFVKVGRYGPMVQLGDTDSEEKPKFAGLRKNQSMDTITFDEAIRLFDFPRKLGQFEEEEVTVAIGRFGPYAKHKNKFYSLDKTDDPSSVDIDRAIELIEEKRKKDLEKIIKVFSENETVQVLKGRYGPYLVINKQNYRIPKNTDPAALTLEECIKISEDPKNKPKKRFQRKKK